MDLTSTSTLFSAGNVNMDSRTKEKRKLRQRKINSDDEE